MMAAPRKILRALLVVAVVGAVAIPPRNFGGHEILFPIKARSVTRSIASRRSSVTSVLEDRGSGGEYYLDVKFGQDTIPVLIDTGSSALMTPGVGFTSWYDCSQCQQESQCPQSGYESTNGGRCTSSAFTFPSTDCCANGGQIQNHYRNTGQASSGTGITSCYGTGGWYGKVYHDVVAFGNGSYQMGFVSASENLCAGTVYWTSTEGSTQPAGNGIMGLAWERLQPEATQIATVAQLAASGVPKSFGVYMCPALQGAAGTATGANPGSGVGTLWFAEQARIESAGWNEANTTYHYVTAPVQSYYTAAITFVEVLSPSTTPLSYSSSNVAPITAGYNTIFDSGTGGLGNVPSDAYDAIVQGINAFSPTAMNFFSEKQRLSQCFSESELYAVTNKNVLDFPLIAFNFSGTRLGMSPTVYITQAVCTSAGFFAFVLAAAPRGQTAIFGNQFLAQYAITFNQNSGQTGFALPSSTSRIQQCGCVYGVRSGTDCSCSGSGISGSLCDTLTPAAASALTAFGRLLDGTSPAVSSSNGSSGGGSSNNTTIIIVVVVAAIALILIIGGVVYYHKQRKSSPAGYAEMHSNLLSNEASSAAQPVHVTMAPAWTPPAPVQPTFNTTQA